MRHLHEQTLWRLPDTGQPADEADETSPRCAPAPGPVGTGSCASPGASLPLAGSFPGPSPPLCRGSGVIALLFYGEGVRFLIRFTREMSCLSTRLSTFTLELSEKEPGKKPNQTIKGCASGKEDQPGETGHPVTQTAKGPACRGVPGPSCQVESRNNDGAI